MKTLRLLILAGVLGLSLAVCALLFGFLLVVTAPLLGVATVMIVLFVPDKAPEKKAADTP